MQLKPTLLTALSALTAVHAIDVDFFCPFETFGACCVGFDPASGLGKLCGAATQVLNESQERPIIKEWACLNNVDRVPACCFGPVTGGAAKCEKPLDIPLPA